jgi:hypothetical protein
MPDPLGAGPSEMFRSRALGPGTWIAASVEVAPATEVTAISLYGLLDEFSDASVHRSLSEITPVFDDPRYRGRVLLGCDLNTWTGWPVSEKRFQARGQPASALRGAWTGRLLGG